MKDILSHSEMLDAAKGSVKAFILLYKKGSEQSDCAYSNFSKVTDVPEDLVLMRADVNTVRDIHSKFGITSAPTVIEIQDGKLLNVIRGCHDKEFYQAMVEHSITATGSANAGNPSHSVTIYTTPTCSYCTTLKTYLRKQGVNYRELDVSRDDNALQEMVNRSGKQGVPQADIDGHMVVGFDKSRINQLLGIQGS